MKRLIITSLPVTGKKKKLLRSLSTVLGQHNKTHARGYKVCSSRTQAARRKTLVQAFTCLFDAGYHMTTVSAFKQKHMKYLIDHWVATGLSPGTIQNRLSHFRAFLRWLGKENMAIDYSLFRQDVERVVRCYATDQDKSWDSQGIDIARVLAKTYDIDPHVYIQMKIALVFGLRRQEAWLCRPYLADQRHYLAINWGAKGGRYRAVPITTEQQRAVLEEAKAYANEVNGSLIPADRSLFQWENHFLYVCTQVGICRKNGVTFHGLRHQYANNQYEKLSRVPSPVRAKSRGLLRKGLDPRVDRRARLAVAEELGHARPEITHAYIGKPGNR